MFNTNIRLKQWISGALLTGVTMASFAQAGAVGRIVGLHVDRAGNYARVWLDSGTINPGNCPAAEYYIVEFPSTGGSRGPMMTALYLAYTQRQSVSMWVQGCTTAQYWGSTRPSAQDVYLNAP
jgi:hypothetical protein